MRYLLLLVVACGPAMTTPDGGVDAGEQPPPACFTLTYRHGPGCDACTASACVDEGEVARVRVAYNSTLNGWACRIDDVDGGANIDCTYRCETPAYTPDAGCGFAP